MVTDKQTKKGQILVIFALAIFGLLARGMLILDGGQAYMNRRNAQMAADAGALAGAYEICFGNPDNAESVAIQYAQVENYSTTAAATVDNTAQTVKVDATISHGAFLGQLFGQPTINASASATAGCFHPGRAEHVLPISWSCRAPVTESISGVCQAKGLIWGTELKPLIDGKDSSGNIVPKVTLNGVNYSTPYDFKSGIVDNKLYIVMDSDKAGEDHCVEIPGGGDELTCDLDGDGAIDLLGAGDRSWLDLDDKNLKSSVTNFYNQTISVHTWVAGKTGVNAAVLDTIEDVVLKKQRVVMIPVVNAICPKTIGVFSPQCQNAAHTGPLGLPLQPGDTDVVLGSNGNTYYHVIGFSPFYVTCVKKQGSDYCPGHEWAVKNGGMKANVKTIEGYFINDYPMDLVYGAGGSDLGINIISLID
jgi:hypothetical protein